MARRSRHRRGHPKLAVFFVALFPQFLDPQAAVLPVALAMATVIVAIDVIWFSILAYVVDPAATLLRQRVRRTMERVTGGVMIAFGISIAAESR